MKRFLWLLIFVGACRMALAAEIPEVRWTDIPPVIDGRTDDPAWAGVPDFADFRQAWEKAPEKVQATHAKLLWDREYLYFMADCSDASIVASITNHDGKLWETDVFELFFQPGPKEPGYFEFEVNAGNGVFDAYFPDRNAYTKAGAADHGRFHLDTAVQVRGTLNHPGDTDIGWTVEGRIPWRDFFIAKGRPEPGDEWRFNLARIDFVKEDGKGTLSATAGLTQPSFHKVDDYSPIRFGEPAWLKKGAPGGTWTNRTLLIPADPPPRYQAQKVYRNATAKFFLAATSIPGTRDILYLENTDYWGGDTHVWRYNTEDPAGKAKDILTVPEKGYSIAFHPGFATNGFVYFGVNGPQNTSPKYSRIVRYTLDPKSGKSDPKSRLMIVEWLSDGHNGAGVCFGNDGMMYVTSGDGSSDSDANNAGQNLAKLTSKVLRLDVDHAPPGKSYAIPQDNPFVGQDGIRGETWCYGCRNPWRITSDPVSGQIWVGENGQDQWEFAYLVRRGANHGWSVFEGSHPFLTKRKLGPDKPVKPEIEHPHSEFRSLTGGVVYRGKKYPALTGAYIYGDFSTGRIWGMLHDGTNTIWHRQLAVTGLLITGFGTDPDGEVLIVDHTAGLHCLEAAPASAIARSFPKKLSETELFTSLKSMEPVAGVFPYEINAQQWADGANGRHWLALPAGATLTPPNTHGWNFPNETVLIQQLEWPGTNGAAPVRLETRLLVRLRNEWEGYSYLWRPDQQDADLVRADGDDLDLSKWVAGTGGPSWHVPSRAECMMCHSRAANYTLGTSSIQLNHVRHDGANQLEKLEEARLLQSDVVGFESWRHDADGVQDELAHLENPKPSVLLPRAGGKMPAEVNPYDVSAPLEARVRSYLSANCAHCHVMSGGGNSSMEFDFFNRLSDLRIIDATPQHWTFDIDRPKLVAPGDPDRSVLYRRLSQREEAAMPPLAINRVDQQAADLFKAWILSLKPAK